MAAISHACLRDFMITLVLLDEFFYYLEGSFALKNLKYCSTEDFVLNRIAFKIFQTTPQCSKFSISCNKALI